MINPFRKNAQSVKPESDPIFHDIGRGEDGRAHADNWLSRNYFENPDELRLAGFTDGAGDILLGLTQAHSEKVVRADGRIEYRAMGGVPVGFKDDRHMTTVAGSRSGKGRSCIIPNLLTYAGSVLVIDCKGENSKATANYRAEKLGHKVHILDPFGITSDNVSQYRSRFNPLHRLEPKSPLLTEDAAMIAEALIIPSGGKDSHWDETAKAFVEGLILHIVTSKPKEERTLVAVAKLLEGMTSIHEVLQEMLQNAEADGRVAAAACAMIDRGEAERGSVLSNARKNLHFICHSSLARCLGAHDFSLDELTNGKTTIYLVLPATRLATCAQWLRVFVNMTLQSVERAPNKSPYPILMVLDEFPVLGRMRELEMAIGQIAGLGLRLWTILQDLGQLKALYGDMWETFLANSGVIQCFGNVDMFTSEWISKYLDKTTITVFDTNPVTALQKIEQGATGEVSRQQQVEMMMPFEVRRYFARDDKFSRQLVLVPGRRPYILQRASYDQHSLFAGRFG